MLALSYSGTLKHQLSWWVVMTVHHHAELGRAALELDELQN